MNIEEIMQPNPATIDMDAPIEKVKEVMEFRNLHHILVIDEERKLTGIISDRDIRSAISPHVGTINENDRDRQTLKKRAHQIMTRNPVTIGTGASVPVAAHKILTTPGSCLPVVNSSSEIQGFVSWKDVMVALIKMSLSTPQK